MKKILLKSGLAWLLSMTCLGVNAQLDEQTYMGYSGNYDVKMVSAPGLQPAWISNTNPMTVVSIVSNEDMFKAGDDLSLNNRYDWNLTGKAAQAALCPAGANAVSQVYADCDDDMNTFQSSAAFLDFGNNMGCTTIKAAYLYWTGTKGNTNYAAYPGTTTMKSYAGGAVGNMTEYDKVKFKAPGMNGYVDVTADRNVTPAGDSYVCMADVTSLVQNRTGGLYWVANLKSGSEKGSGGARAGWSLIVIYSYPNCPQRVIKFWDQNGKTTGAGNGTTIKFNFKDGEVPASGNSVSYLGFIGLDGEDTAPLIMDNIDLKGTETQEEITAKSKAIAEENKIVFNGGNGNKDIQPFITDQDPVYACNEKSVCGERVYCGFVSSQTTTYDPENGLNGNQITRLPNNIIALGYDAHHVKLPAGSMAGGAKSASAKMPDEQNGNYQLVMAYMAIETQQAILLMDKRSVETSTKPDGEVTYELTVRNIGTKASIGTSIVLDTLDKTLDFVTGSVKFLDKNGSEITTGTFNVINQGADENEVLTFTIPSIAAGDGANANDWITIQFKAKVKGLDRTDIWAYGCNRQVKNKAVVIYKNDAGADVRTGSNSSGGCDGESIYFYTPVVDEDLEKSYLQSHHDTLDLSQEPNAGAMKVLSTLRARLQVHLNDLGLSIDPALFTFFEDATGFEVSQTAVFDVNQGNIDFTATADLGGGCEEAFYFNVKVTKRPAIEVKEEIESEHIAGQTSYKGRGDAKIEIRAFNGNPPYVLKVYDESGNVVYAAGTSLSDYLFVASGLKPGVYTAQITDAKGFSVSASKLKVVDPVDMVVSISGVPSLCKHLPLTLNAEVSGRDPNSVQYVWRKDGSDVGTNSSYSEGAFETSATYTLFVCDGSGQEIATKSVNAIPTPTMEVIPVDSGCDAFYLPESYGKVYDSWLAHEDYPDSIIGIFAAREVSGDASLNASHIKMTYFDEKGVQITSGKTSDPGRVTAVMTVDETCSDQGNTTVSILDFEACFPIIVSKFFSPDANGQNDVLTISGINDWHYEAQAPHLIVFDRYGKKVYEADYEQIKQGWDGTYNGDGLPSGDYWYELSFNNLKSKVGHFTLKRRKE